MLIGILSSLFFFMCLFLILVIMLQKGKGGMGIGSIGGGTQMLFGGSGGQDLFQKTTWVLVAFFMGGSLIISVIKSRTTGGARYIQTDKYKTFTQQRRQPRQ